MVEKRKLNNSKYTVERVLGSGRFSQTLLAYHTAGDRKDERLVIKTLRMFDKNRTPKSSEEIKKLNDKLHREATKLSKCDHPHVVQLIDEEFTETDSFRNEWVCLPLEYICGVSLEKLNQRVLPEKEALRYIRQIGEALIAVHKKGLVHLDVKPDNILVRQKTDEAVLIGFDFSRAPSHGLSEETQKFASDGFAALEWYLTEDKELAELGPWSDVYSLAALFYWLLTGVVPPSAKDRHEGTKPLKSLADFDQEISNRVKNAIEKGMAIKRNDRPQTVKAWLNLLGGYRFNFDWFEERHVPKWTALGALAAVAGVFVGIYFGFMSLKNSTPSPQIEPTPSEEETVENQG
ncbi:serine/threonine protein kinase [Roseofilum capinflatum]|uniref:Serine/threonine-protein kinase n=1 Tax=Roseofilum capinflatum BLCC-M114 TaxID=3022440 RepID=A0ABT7B4W4_9CYAN|nr:serine/threonine-protein kinase [Roseofilum capinflatum]MDJ1174222.1 serine/threonine-protein kinase [Roseofilum capinflatum BLCC-M114]